MIAFKTDTTSAAVLAAIANVFAVMAREAAGEPVAAAAPIEAAALFAAEVDDVDAPEVDDAAEFNLQLPPPPTDATAATLHSLQQAGVELDSAGFPWDHRIHASTKSKIADGTWKVKPKTDKALIEQVRAEFRQTAAAPLTVAPPVNQVPTPPAAAVEPAPQAAAPAADEPRPPAPPASVQDKPTNPALLFSATMKAYADAEKRGLFTPGYGNEWAKAQGLPNISALITRPDLCGAFFDLIQQVGG